MSNERYIFRGKRIDNGEWVQGSFFEDEYTGGTYNAYIMYEMLLEIDNDQNCEIFGQSIFEVAPYSVGQCTGLKDKNGMLIFEGDILNSTHGDVKGAVKYGECTYSACDKYECKRIGYYIEHSFEEFQQNTGIPLYDANLDKFEIIGNVWDNPELLKVESQYMKNS